MEGAGLLVYFQTDFICLEGNQAAGFPLSSTAFPYDR